MAVIIEILWAEYLSVAEQSQTKNIKRVWVIFMQSRKKGNRLAQIGLRWPMMAEKPKNKTSGPCLLDTNTSVFVYFLAFWKVMYLFNSTLYLYQTASCQRRFEAICVNSNQQLSFHLCFSIFLHFLIHTLIFLFPKIWIIHPALMQKCNIRKLNAMI